ncbi:hypothetical protein DFH09DRAFT_1436134 [Mycena vulgaris]|nr:hypothetical protein DFH09DRAFT_1436134 [Mycena vulgaris]
MRSNSDFPHLLHLGTFGMHSYENPNRASPPTLVPRLQSLLLAGSPEFLHFFDIPTLQHLEVELHWHATPALTAFLSRSARHLHNLTIRMNCLLDESSQSASRRYQASQASNCYSPPYPITTMASLLPQLRTLLITDDTLRAVFSSVLRKGQALTHVELHIRPRDAAQPIAQPDHIISLQFKALAAHGVTLRVTTPTCTWAPDSHEEDAVGDLGAGFSQSGRSIRTSNELGPLGAVFREVEFDSSVIGVTFFRSLLLYIESDNSDIRQSPDKNRSRSPGRLLERSISHSGIKVHSHGRYGTPGHSDSSRILLLSTIVGRVAIVTLDTKTNRQRCLWIVDHVSVFSVPFQLNHNACWTHKLWSAFASSLKRSKSSRDAFGRSRNSIGSRVSSGKSTSQHNWRRVKKNCDICAPFHAVLQKHEST